MVIHLTLPVAVPAQPDPDDPGAQAQVKSSLTE
jgi:hypothetical protein